MLKTNSRKAVENIRSYIVEKFDPTNYQPEPVPLTFPEIAGFILRQFKAEKTPDNRRMTEQALFIEWAAGLPSVLDTCYYYNRSAVDDLGAILEESDTEKAKYSESDPEDLLTRLIYRELMKGAVVNA